MISPPFSTASFFQQPLEGTAEPYVYLYPDPTVGDAALSQHDPFALFHRHDLAAFDPHISGKACLPSSPIGPRATPRPARPARLPRRRPLVTALVASKYDAMAVDSAPGSPPELTASKSSKSSSYHSSTIPDANGFNDTSHFEDISLDDLHHALPQELYSNHASTVEPHGTTNTDKRARSRPSSPPSTAMIHAMHPMRSLRDLTSGQKTRSANSKGIAQAKSREKPSLSLPGARSGQRGSARSSSPSSRVPAPAGRRSTSPFNAQTVCLSPRSISQSSSRTRADRSPARPSTKRRSWQSARKSARELEEEYDSDEDVPDDAFIWNVPLSPRPPPERSPSRSPQRRPPMMPPGLDRPGSEDKRSSASAEICASPQTCSPTSPGLQRFSTSSSVPDLSRGHSLPRTRTKSWTAALSDLSEEAKVLTEALELHAEQSEQRREERVQNGGSASKTESDSTRRSASTVELPPLQKGNIMIDPLPISREKEKVLTRTRPSWLPPKNPQEEKKHLKEYQRMVAHSMEADKRRTAKLQEQQRQKDLTRNSITHIWDNHVIPNWTEVVHEPQIRRLWWLGLPEKRRGVIWEKAIGNDLGISEKSYRAALQRGRSLEKKLSAFNPEERSKIKEWAWFEAIRRDVRDAFPELNLFQAGGPMTETLSELLVAYSMYRSDVGYVHGTHLVAALLLLNLPAPAAFVTLANLFNRPLPMSFLVHDSGAMSRAYELVLKTLKYKIPKLHEHLTETLGLQPAEYLDPMFQTLFCARSGADVASRIWDVYAFEGDKALIRAAVGTLWRLEGRLYGSREEVLALLGWSTCRADVGTEEEFIEAVRTVGKA